jgi:hypothetical protein
VEEGEQLRLLIRGPDFNTGETAETTLVVDATGRARRSGWRIPGLLLLPEGDVHAP